MNWKVVKTLFAFTFAFGPALAIAGETGDQTPAPVPQGQPEQYNEDYFSNMIPRTLVVRDDGRGHYAIYHSNTLLPLDYRVGPDIRFLDRFDYHPRNYGPRDLNRSFWGFFWNVLSPNSYPTYHYYNHEHNFTHDYEYRPYHSYSDHGITFRFYRWSH